MEKINYQLCLDKIIESLNFRPRLLLHACCAPCASYVLEYLSRHFAISLLFYNPNIYPPEEYYKRYDELKRLVLLLNAEKLSETGIQGDISLIECDYIPSDFTAAAKGFEKEREGGARCDKCFKLRLNYTAKVAAENNFDFFATTLTVSPHKNAPLINHIGDDCGKRFTVKYLPSDFKKREGYKRSIELCKKYNIYRQNYCGCEFSLPVEKDII